METQSKRISSNNATSENRTRAREEFLFPKCSLKKRGNERLEKAKESAQACFLNEGEGCSKYWFALNKPKEPNMILGLQDEECVIQTETRKMVEIASNYHKQLQEKPQINMAMRNAITKMKKHVKEKLHDVDITKLRAETSAEDVKEAIKQSQTGKCPGHSGITYEFWKSWKEPKKNNEGNDDKKTISISSILQSVFNDIERHGIEDETYTKE